MDIKVIKVAICDDESKLCTQLEEQIERTAEEYIFKCEIDIFFTGEKLCEYLENGKIYDVIFLDIELKTMNGVNVGETIRKRYGMEVTQIVYISAKEKYALQLFKTRPLDFLIKPIHENAVVEVMQNVMEIIQKNESELFEYHVGYDTYKRPIKEIIYFESVNRTVNIYSTQGIENFYSTLRDIMKQVNAFQFIRIHQSYLVNLNHVVKFEYEQVKLSNGECLTIAQARRKQVRNRVIKHQFGGGNGHE